MSFMHNDINDDEIRIISSDGGHSQNRRRSRRTLYMWLALIVALVVAGVIAAIYIYDDDEDEQEFSAVPVPLAESAAPVEVVATDTVVAAKPFTIRRDTVVDGVALTVLTPRNAVPSLAVGADVLNDTLAVLIAQAADVRRDNGGIVGAYVLRGELIGKGEAKAGFCSIINGEITVGVADATPMLEQALTTDGYFFRQYPLVVGGQVVENKPKGKAVRKALAELDGQICVIISNDKVTFHDFAQALVSAGVRNAIYLVGSNSSGRYVDADGNAFIFGKTAYIGIKNINFIVWR